MVTLSMPLTSHQCKICLLCLKVIHLDVLKKNMMESRVHCWRRDQDKVLDRLTVGGELELDYYLFSTNEYSAVLMEDHSL